MGFLCRIAELRRSPKNLYEDEIRDCSESVEYY